jgi:hypothetical protein
MRGALNPVSRRATRSPKPLRGGSTTTRLRLMAQLGEECANLGPPLISAR